MTTELFAVLPAVSLSEAESSGRWRASERGRLPSFRRWADEATVVIKLHRTPGSLSLIMRNMRQRPTTKPRRDDVSQPNQSLRQNLQADSSTQRSTEVKIDGEDLVSPFTGSNRAINDQKRVGLLDRG